MAYQARDFSYEFLGQDTKGAADNAKVVDLMAACSLNSKYCPLPIRPPTWPDGKSEGLATALAVA